MLQAGYLEDWSWGATLSGAPQGGVVSPLLSNIYLHKLDEFVDTVLIPEYTRGGIKAISSAYSKLSQAKRRAYRRGDRARVRALWKLIRSLPSRDPYDPGYRRLRYIRYADDQLLGFTGPKAEVEQIKHRLTAFLRDELKLELSAEKTLITHARTGAARFLGYAINVQHADTKLTRGRRAVNGTIRLSVPPDVIRQKCVPYMRRGKPERRPVLIHRDDYDIVRIYGAEYRGIIQYYQLAQNVHRFSHLRWVALTSMLKTLANKHNSRVTKMANKYKTTIETPQGKRTCFEVRVPRKGRNPLVARFGGIPLVKQQRAILRDHAPKQVHTYPRKELIKRLRNGRCELCHDTDNVQVHHVRTLTELGKPDPAKPTWINHMAKKRRKTLIVCARCHDHIHTTQLTA